MAWVRMCGKAGNPPVIKYIFSGYGSSSNDLRVRRYEDNNLVLDQRVSFTGWEQVLWTDEFFRLRPSVQIDPATANWYLYANSNITANNINYNLNTIVQKIIMGQTTEYVYNDVKYQS